jgi:hypothetical protein
MLRAALRSFEPPHARPVTVRSRGAATGRVTLEPTWGISPREEKNMEYALLFALKWNMVEYGHIPLLPRNYPELALKSVLLLLLLLLLYIYMY